MFMTKKSRHDALLSIANSAVIACLVHSFVQDSRALENSWLTTRTNHKKDNGVREIIVEEDSVEIRPVLKGQPTQKGIIYGLEVSGYSKITAHKNDKGRVIVNQKNMIKLFAEEFAAQLIMSEFGLPCKPKGSFRKDSNRPDTTFVVIKYTTK